MVKVCPAYERPREVGIELEVCLLSTYLIVVFARSAFSDISNKLTSLLIVVLGS